MLRDSQISAYVPVSNVERGRQFYEGVLMQQPREVGEAERGVTFERYDFPGSTSDGDIVSGGGAKAAWFKDPDGNILALIQVLARPAVRG
jgi:hypothetical protein